MLIFVLQAVWLYISELAGKDLDASIILKFLLYVTPTLIPLILPLTILVASIMVFGSFAENYEFAAMKSTGISLQRAMRGLSVFIVILAIGAFFFSNNVIPAANHNFYNLRNNIKKEKPALAITEGQFIEVGNINIRVAKKSGDRGQFLDSIKIHKKKPNRKGNYTVIVAEKGELISSEESNILQLELINGNFYDEILNKNPSKNINRPHAKSTFEKYTINVDLGNVGNVDYNNQSIDNKYNMLNVSGLNYTIDSLNLKKNEDKIALSKSLYNRSGLTQLNTNITPVKDSTYSGNILDLFDTKTKTQLLKLALNTVNSTVQVIDSNTKTLALKSKWRNQHIIALHEKYVLSFACIILFFVGAPLGALIRKGGIGLPMVIAVLLFLTYHFIGIFAKSSVKGGGDLNPVLATWLSTLIMLPLGIYLTSRATNDRGLFNFDVVLDPLKKLFKASGSSSFIDKNGVNFSYIQNYSNDKLVSILKDYKQFDLDKSSQIFALNILQQRKVNIEVLEENPIKLNSEFRETKKTYRDYLDYSKTALTTFCIGAVFIGLHFIFKNNELPQLATSIRDLGFISFFIFLIYFVVSNFYYSRFYKNINRKNKRTNLLLLLLSLPFYPITLFFTKYKIKKDFNKTYIENIK